MSLGRAGLGMAEEDFPWRKPQLEGGQVWLAWGEHKESLVGKQGWERDIPKHISGLGRAFVMVDLAVLD